MQAGKQPSGQTFRPNRKLCPLALETAACASLSPVSVTKGQPRCRGVEVQLPIADRALPISFHVGTLTPVHLCLPCSEHNASCAQAWGDIIFKVRVLIQQAPTKCPTGRDDYAYVHDTAIIAGPNECNGIISTPSRPTYQCSLRIRIRQKREKHNCNISDR